MTISQAGRAYQTPGQVRKAFVIKIASIIVGVGLFVPTLGCLEIYSTPSKLDQIGGFYQMTLTLLELFFASSILGVILAGAYLLEMGGLPRYRESLAQAYADEADYLAKVALPFQKSSIDTVWAALKR